MAGERYNLDILVYSGDSDSVCGLWGTQVWMNGLGFDVNGAHWAPWKDNDGQPAGFVTQFDKNLTLVTVHGAGHEVPTYTPKTAFQILEFYFNRKWFDPTAFKGEEAKPMAAEF